MEKIELFYVTGTDFHIWKRMEELFEEARFSDLEDLIELEPIKVRSIKTTRDKIDNTKEVIEVLNSDLVKWISDEELFLIYYSYKD